MYVFLILYVWFMYFWWQIFMRYESNIYELCGQKVPLWVSRCSFDFIWYNTGTGHWWPASLGCCLWMMNKFGCAKFCNTKFCCRELLVALLLTAGFPLLELEPWQSERSVWAWDRLSVRGSVLNTYVDFTFDYHSSGNAAELPVSGSDKELMISHWIQIQNEQTPPASKSEGRRTHLPGVCYLGN